MNRRHRIDGDMNDSEQKTKKQSQVDEINRLNRIIGLPPVMREGDVIYSTSGSYDRRFDHARNALRKKNAI